MGATIKIPTRRPVYRSVPLFLLLLPYSLGTERSTGHQATFSLSFYWLRLMARSPAYSSGSAAELIFFIIYYYRRLNRRMAGLGEAIDGSANNFLCIFF